MSYDLTKMQDITISEQPLLATYNNFFTTQQLFNLPQFLADNPNLKYKIFNAENWNRIAKSISDSGYATQWFDTVNYAVDSLVYIQGTPSTLYQCLQSDNVGKSPTNSPLYWKQVNSDSGATTNSLEGAWNYDFSALYKSLVWIPFAYKGEWQATTAYQRGNMVTVTTTSTTPYGTTESYKIVYLCLATNTGNVPQTATTYWLKAFQNAESLGIQVSATPPSNLQVGDIYIQTL